MDLKRTSDGHLLAPVPSISSDIGEGFPVLQRREETWLCHQSVAKAERAKLIKRWMLQYETAQPWLTEVITLHAHASRLPSEGHCCHRYLPVVKSTEGWFYCCCHWEGVSCKMNGQQRFLRIKKCQHNINVGTATHLGSCPFKKPVQWAWHRGDPVNPLDRLLPSCRPQMDTVGLGSSAPPPHNQEEESQKKDANAS